MKTKTISPAALIALKEALTNIYWYKKELKSFLLNSLDCTDLLARIDWNDYKRNICNMVVDYLVRNQTLHQADLFKLMSEVMKVEDFSHLEKLENGKDKAKVAKNAVEALKKICMTHEEFIEQEKQFKEKRKKYQDEISKCRGVQEKLIELKELYFELLSANNSQAKGYELEKIMKELFIVFDLDPKASFRIIGEQIDGAFTFDNTDYLFEGKWQKELIAIDDLDAFGGKLSRKLDNTLGLFLSINGFSQTAVTAYAKGRPLMILMDGSELMAVLEDRIDLVALLKRKRRHAAQTGNIYLRLTEILSDSL